MSWIYDTHVHLSDPAYGPDLPVILYGMECMRIKACTVSMDATDSKKTLELAGQSGLILPFVGVHPERAAEGAGVVIELIEADPGAIAGIGEVGLDPYFCASKEDTQRQREVFEAMLTLAEKYNKPVSIHSRGGLDEILSIMPSYSPKTACLHWFDGGKKRLRTAMDMGLFVSYGPVTVYANDKQNLLARTDEDRILVETDGPVRFAGCFGHRQAQAGFIPSVILCASSILHKTYDETCALLELNSERFLGQE